MAIWFTLAPVPLGPYAVFAPGHVLIAGALAAAGAAHLLLLREVRMLGAGLVGVTMLLLAGVNVWLPAMVGQPDAPGAAPALFMISVVILVTALGMQLMTFEDMTYELRRTNRAAGIGAKRSASTGDHGYVDRMPEPSLLPGGDHARAATASALRDAAVDRVHRHRSLQGHQRHARS